MQQYGRSTNKTTGGTELHANGNRKKSILKKSESSSHGGDHRHGASSGGGGSSQLQKSSSGSKHDPELENLLVSDQESANTTPAVARKPIAIVDLPPTANHEQIKSLTGPKLRKSEQSLKPILVNSSAAAADRQHQNLSKNNGTASKEIQTSTISLLALAAAAQNQAAANAALQNANGSSDNTKKFERGRDMTDTATSPVFRCPNDMCRHNRPSTALTSTKRKICLCGRTMVSPGGPLLYSDRIASS